MFVVTELSQIVKVGVTALTFDIALQKHISLFKHGQNLLYHCYRAVVAMS